jgi:hypothetical protein
MGVVALSTMIVAPQETMLNADYLIDLDLPDEGTTCTL